MSSETTANNSSSDITEPNKNNLSVASYNLNYNYPVRKFFKLDLLQNCTTAEKQAC